MRATLVAFAVSALMHEYVFGVALGVQGYQTAFFLLQSVAVMVELRWRSRRAGRRLPRFAAWALHSAWLCVTTTLFFARMEHILAFDSHFPDATVVTLERNYRSSQPTLEVLGPVSHKRSDLNELRTALLQSPSTNRGKADMESLGNVPLR